MKKLIDSLYKDFFLKDLLSSVFPGLLVLIAAIHLNSSFINKLINITSRINE